MTSPINPSRLQEDGRLPLRGTASPGLRPEPQEGLGPDGRVPTGAGQLTLLRSMVTFDIERDGATTSTMVRAGLLADILDELVALRAINAELYEALERAVEISDRLCLENGWERRADAEQVYQIMRAALSKARGQS